MDILKLIHELGALYLQYGNLQVGILDGEFCYYREIEKINYIIAKEKTGGLSDDDESLWKEFIGID